MKHYFNILQTGSSVYLQFVTVFLLRHEILLHHFKIGYQIRYILLFNDLR